MPEQTPQPDAYQEAAFQRLGKGIRRGASGQTDGTPESSEMRRNRRVAMRKQGSSGTTPSTAFATGRPRDPLFYWKQNNLPYETDDEAQLKQLRVYCNTPDAPVWMGDYSFKPIGEIVAGDEVIGWEYRTGPTGAERARLVRTKVLASSRRIAPEVVKVTFESGAVIKCTPDHLWANYLYCPGGTHEGRNGWKQPEFWTVKVGRKLKRVIEPTEPLTDEKLRIAAAWLGGVYDGEGTAERLAQDEVYNPAVRERMKDYLDLLGLPWTEHPDYIGITRSGRTKNNRAKQDFVNFLNWTDPVRRVTTAIDKKLLTQPQGGTDTIISVESMGPGEVVSMQTETGNYTAWGFASKNCRLLYQTHPIIASCIDIYTKYPLLGMELRCKDEKITQFYTDLFFTEDGLNYDDFLLDVGREYWTVGEAWPFATFNESLGIWDDEELLNPDDVMVQRSAFLKDPRFLIRLPETLREVIQRRQPAWEYEKLMKVYPELSRYAGADDMMPVSNILLRQLKFKADTFSKRGIPILMRAMRAIMQEEMLNSAQDAVADRLYTPLVLVKLGASATDLGTQVPWIPTPDDLEDFMESLDSALAADFRALVHNFAVTMEPVFGRENMPDMTPDFERLEDRILQSFGLSRTMLNGASSGETYAADALNRDLVSQLLTTYQDMIKRHFHQRALVVAEAQEHYDYDERNGKRYVKTEEVLEIDEQGNERIIEQPKLLVPELIMRTMSLSDAEAEKEFYESLRAAGVPISMRTRLLASGIEFDDEVERTQEEQVQLAVAEQETRKKVFQALKDKGLPIPADLRSDFQPVAEQAQQPALPVPMDAGMPMRTPMMGTDDLAPTPTLAPTQMDLGALPPAGGVPLPGMPAQPVEGQDDAPPGVPDESNEQREGMPKPAVLFRQSERTRTAARERYEEPKWLKDVPPQDQEPLGRFAAPKVVGIRRHIHVDPTLAIEE